MGQKLYRKSLIIFIFSKLLKLF